MIAFEETFWTLLQDKAHWEFEIFLMILFDGLIFGIFWNFIKKHWKHHIARDEKEATEKFENVKWICPHCHKRNFK